MTPARTPPAPIRVPLCLCLVMRTGKLDTGVICPHCGDFHQVDLPGDEDVSAPILCPDYPRDMPMVAFRRRQPD